MSDEPLRADMILRYLGEIANELGPEGQQHVVLVVGGSLLALHGLRDTTLDIDSVRRG